MQEASIKNQIKTGQLQQKNVLIYIQSNYFRLTGNWQWDLQADAVFCSDVILTLPTEFYGTKSIIHPDDLENVKQALLFLQEHKSTYLQFRIITTYGTVQTLLCEDVSLSSDEEDFEVTYTETDLFRDEKARDDLYKENARWFIKLEGYQHAERLTETGTWFINASTGDTVYSDQVFRIYGLQPQSLNMHPYSFFSFIYQADQAIVVESFEKAYREKLPLDIEFRIVRADGEERHVRQTMQWSFSMNGSHILHGVLHDITREKESELKLEQVENELLFLEKLLKLQEHDSSTGYWYSSLLIRKTVFSDNYFRIFGIKPQSIPSSFSFFLKYVHLDDQKIVEETIWKARHEHSSFDIQYRIIRPDGKTRNIRHTGKTEIYANSELVLVGVIQDLTQQRLLEDKLNRQLEGNIVQNFVLDYLEDTVNVGSFVWDLQLDKITWSKYLYKLTGLKPNSLNPSAKFILKFIHPACINIYNGELNLVLQGHERGEFEINMLVKNETRQVNVKLTLLTQDGKNFLTASFRDITEKIKQEHEAIEHKQLFEQLIENLPDRVMITDTNYSFILWNKACEEKYKQKKEHVEGCNYFDVFPEQKTTETLNNFNDVLHGKVFHLHHLPNHSKGYDDWHMLPLKNDNDEIIGILHILQDVSSDYKLKQQLSERLNFIENLVDSTVDRIIALDKNMNYLYWNKKSEEYYGVKKEQVIGKNILEVFPGLLNDPSYNEFRKAMRGETVQLTERDTSENGYFYETYLIPIKNEKDEVTAVLWITHDFSNEYRLLSEQKIAHEILDTVDEACFEMDAESRLIYVNKKAEQLWNKSREELLHHNLWEVFPQAADSPLHIAINTVLEDRVVVQQEFLSPVQRRWIYVMTKPSEKGVVVLFLDIHDMKQNQKKTIQVLNALHESYYELDREFRVIFMNKKAEQFFNISNEEMTGKVLWDVFPQIKETPLFDAIVKAMEQNLPTKDIFTSPLKGTKNLVSITPTGEGIAVIFMPPQILKERC